MMTTLSLDELRQFDRGGQRGTQQRFCCPLSDECRSKSRTPEHRSLAVDMQTGVFMCHRCQAKGKLTEFWDDPAGKAGSVSKRTYFSSESEAAPTSSDESKSNEKIAAILAECKPLVGTPGADYLASRGIPLAIAEAAGVVYSPNYSGPDAVIFPFRDREGQLVALYGRYINPQGQSHRCIGSIKSGVFATPGAWEAGTVFLVEAAIDALSLAACGCPTIALSGLNVKDRLLPNFADRTVVITFDNDDAGNNGAIAWMDALRKVVRCGVCRLKPMLKDVNAMLMEFGLERLRTEIEALARRGWMPQMA